MKFALQMLGNVAMIGAIWAISYSLNTSGNQTWQSVLGGFLVAVSFSLREAALDINA